MKRRHTSYKLEKVTSLKEAVTLYQQAKLAELTARQSYSDALKLLQEAETDSAKLKQQIISLLQDESKKSITVNRVKYSLDSNGELVQEIVL